MNTKEKFANYLSQKGYSMLTIQDPNETGSTAIVIGRPNISDFTQVKDIGQALWEVRLSVDDYDNKDIIKTRSGPKRQPNAKRKTVVVRFQYSEYEAVKAYASQVGLTASDIIRTSVKAYVKYYSTTSTT